MALARFGRLATCALAAALGAGCGGGGGSGSAVPSATPSPTPTANCSDSIARVPMTSRRGAASAASDVVPNRLYVTYQAASGVRSGASVARAVNASRTVELGSVQGQNVAAVTIPDGMSLASATASLKATPGVVDVQPLHYRHVTSCTPTANDGRFNSTEQWYLFRTSVPNGAWTLTHGAGITVAVIDTGADETNQDLAVKIDLKESIVSGVVKNGAGSVQDTNGHGTNVAGLVAAATNNSYGYASTGWDVRLQIYKVFPDATSTSDQQNADTADEAHAINDAVANGASVINLSLGGAQSNGVDTAEKNAVAAAIAAGVTVVAAGGNEYPTTDGQQPDYPAAYPGVIAVGASAVQDATPGVYSSITTESAASYSNSGVTLLAPGGDAPSSEGGTGGTPIDPLHWIEGYSTSTAAYPPDKCSNSGGVCAAYFNGTSQATPQVSAAVALMMAYHGGVKSLAPSRVSQLLSQTTDVLPGISSTRQGAGRLNVYAAVAAAHP